MADPSLAASGKRQFGCGQVLVIVLLTALVSGGLVLWWAKRNLYTSELRPVALGSEEQEVLAEKLELLETRVSGEILPEAPREGAPIEDPNQDPAAEPYSERFATRQVEISERELNAMIAQSDPDAGRHLAVDLSQDLVSLKLIVPMEEGIPIVGGKTIRIRAGFWVRFDGQGAQPNVVLKGVSLGGLPLPSAWLGGMKGKDFIAEFGQGGGFWEQFSEGIEALRVEDGRLSLTLKE